MTARAASRRATIATPPWSSSTTSGAAGGLGPAATVLDRIAPMSVSGGGWGPDGKLYLSGHDLPELYVMTLPMAAACSTISDTIGMEAEGQAIDWDESQPGMLYGITRRTKEILAMKVPPAK
jgi:hypothetical protein